jgi:aromatic-L-amino-acid/L-tryptophan decarboxylase
MELSRPFRALKIWLSMQYHGMKAFQESIKEDLRLARLLAELIDAEPLLERLAPVSLSAVCFRYVGKDEDTNAVNRTILDRVVRRGCVYISNARIGDAFALRACIVSHRSTKEDVQSVIAEVLASAGEV